MLGRPLGKITVNGRRRNGQKYFAECRPKHSAIFFLFCRVPGWKALGKDPLPRNFLPRGLCRVLHSAKPLPSAKGSLPSVKTLGKAAASSSVNLHIQKNRTWDWWTYWKSNLSINSNIQIIGIMFLHAMTACYAFVTLLLPSRNAGRWLFFTIHTSARKMKHIFNYIIT